jgi:hypothetical protein
MMKQHLTPLAVNAVAAVACPHDFLLVLLLLLLWFLAR